jgi:hypothetical protein
MAEAQHAPCPATTVDSRRSTSNCVIVQPVAAAPVKPLPAENKAGGRFKSEKPVRHEWQVSASRC